MCLSSLLFSSSRPPTKRPTLNIEPLHTHHKQDSTTEKVSLSPIRENDANLLSSLPDDMIFHCTFPVVGLFPFTQDNFSDCHPSDHLLLIACTERKSSSTGLSFFLLSMLCNPPTMPPLSFVDSLL
mmetsp:Transcript_2166/g.7922  ORF Transcript_2166/g.7922 Transcript_2166/m.7922 type:complete len:126 (-) Transcript_2166:12322-12699(-)